MTISYRRIATALPLLLLAPAAHAQSAQSTEALEQATRAGDDVIVTAARAATPAETVAQAVTVLDTATIERRQTVVLADLLRQTPGIAVARTGGVGGVTSVFIRGAESDQTAALIDGVKINDPSAPGGGFNFGELLVGNIARVEVLRGASSVLWGSQAIGGVVNMITRQPTDRLSVNARAEGGSMGTGQAFANVSGRAGAIAASLGGGYYTTDGISSYARGSERDGFRHYGGNASVTATLASNVSLDLRGFYANGRTEFDGFPPPDYTFNDTREYSDAEQWVGYGGVNVALFDGALRNRLGYARTDIARTSYDRDLTPRETYRSQGQNYRVEYQGVADLGAVARATFGAEREISRLYTRGYGSTDRGRARLFSVYGQLALTPLAGVTATGGVRHDDHDRFGGATVGAASLAWTPNDGATLLRGSWSQGFKAPTLFQLNGSTGNPNLRPERSEGWDAGVTQRALDGTLEASATWFRRVSRDLINTRACSPAVDGPICDTRPFGIYDNVARTRAQGLEVALTLRPVEALTVVAAYTYLDGENRSPGASFGLPLLRRPRDSTTVNADYRWPFGLSTGVTLTAVGDSYDVGQVRLDGYVLADLRAALPLTDKVELYARLENAFDQRYVVAVDYGNPGRAAYGGVRLRY
ncbi:TonB-dependent receptor domain-containing protein [Sphingomonas sp. BK580]|uniref:TonB-dependent receptor plug domain-containing protein n=1 Tax=Sphingomonas sp. BK580 TaxID=2586972 RepID=UPI001810478B|nr:TonB-dependent receptor [Sphingomonas sp. BK580]MBB3693496.1 vitamin B12 transporter [Sphingomonas sp. BK580]